VTPPLRIVSLAPSQTEILASLGLPDCLIGITEDCDHPPAVAALPRFGSWYDPHLERVCGAHPDLVCTFGRRREEVRDSLQQSGIQVFHADPPILL
jgi:iron complex transport system substrate-binding protein